MVLAVLGVLVVASLREQATLPDARDCPPAELVTAAVGAAVAAPTAVGRQDLLGCYYARGESADAVSVVAAVPGPKAASHDPCRSRPSVAGLGRRACAMSGTPGAPGPSLLVETGTVQYQFSSALAAVSLARLQVLAARVLAGHPLPVRA